VSIGKEERGSSADRLRGGGRDTTAGTQEENISHVTEATRASHVDR
jgi:hypothetical protein